ncbi:hypothetical protein MMC18_007552 [Xylographa bjoerkii]|nr:hypothetical protein [Xylographa bjoerkii]
MASGDSGTALAPRVLGLDIQRQSHPIEKLRKRGHTDMPLYPTNNAWIYVANVSIGTPPQTVSIQIDTGSSDFWVNTPNSNQCTSGPFGCPFGTYSANASSTYQYVNSLLFDSYLAGTNVSGDFATDVLSFAGATLKNLTMGIAYESFDLVNIWGIGQPNNEGFAKGLQQYPNSPFQMVQNGLIQSPTYSLWMNSPNATAGSLLFGGVDTSKYQGQLATLPVEKNSSGLYDYFRVNLSSISLNGSPVSTNASEFPQTAVLDTGNPLTIVPDDTFQNIVAELNLTNMVMNGLAYTPCSLASSAVIFTFQFAGVNISVPISSLVTAPNALALQAYTGGNFKVPDPGMCVLMIVPMALTRSTYIVLGDSFLENAYVVHDLANSLISLAPTNFNPANSNVVEIPAGTGGVAAALKAAGSGTGTPTSGGSIPTATASSTSGSSSPTATSAAAGGFGGKMAGLMVSGPAIGMALVGLL